MKKSIARGFCLFMIVPLFFASCKKDNNNNDQNQQEKPLTVDSNPQIKCTVDGMDFHFEQTATNGIESFMSADQSIASYPDTSMASWSSSIYDVTNDKAIFRIEKGTLHFVGGSPENDDFKAFFSPGTYSFSVDLKNGFQVEWYDSNGKQWTSYFGTGDQSGSAITIDDMKDEEVFGTYQVRVKISFHCMLYEDGGNSIELTNGVYVGSFGNL